MRLFANFINYLVFLNLIVCSSCNNPRILDGGLIRIPIREEAFLLKDTLSNHMIIDKVIKLESHPSALMGIILQIETADNLIFIRKQDKTEDLLVFSADGKFLRNICTKGKGPGEAMDLSGFIVDSIKKEVYLMDEANKLIVKDYSGRLVAEYKCPYGSNGVIKIDQDHLGISAGGQYSVYLTDMTGHEIKHFLPVEPMFHSVKIRPFLNTGDEVLYQRNMNDTLYILNQDSLVPRYLIDFGDKALTRKQFFEFPANSMGERKIGSQFMYGPTFFGNSGDNIALSFYYNNKNFMAFIDLSTRKCCIFEWSQIKNDPMIASYMALCSSSNKDWFIGYIIPGNLDMAKIPPILASVKPITEDENPILIFYRFSIGKN
jgi:hypothetical protein